MKSKKFKALLITGITLGAVVVGAAGFLGIVSLSKNCRKNNDPEHATNTTGLVQAIGSSLYDKDGNKLRLNGTNAGNALVYEGWLSPFSCGALTNEDGSYQTDADGNVEYPELTTEEVYAGFKSNPNLTDAQRKELYNLYLDNWFSKEDFKRVKDLGMNAIRLPFYWRNLLTYENGVYTRKDESEAFSYFDNFLANCKENNIYCILDLHGAPVTQNGYEHSGSMSKDLLWDDDKAIDATCDLWSYIAEHYINNELGKYIATYDILNEPTATYRGKTEDKCYPIFDKIYKAIRNAGDQHCITIETTWLFDSFKNPKKYEWENIQYEIHIYNWNSSTIPYSLFYDYYELTNWFHNWNVPYLVGEFSFFDDANAWNKYLAMYDKRGYSWTTWTYKKVVVGWWNDSWGLYNLKLHLDNNTHEAKLDLRNATYEQLHELALKVNTSNAEESNTYTTIKGYLTK